VLEDEAIIHHLSIRQAASELRLCSLLDLIESFMPGFQAQEVIHVFAASELYKQAAIVVILLIWILAFGHQFFYTVKSVRNLST
jgi:predicted RNase H-related nuclease YkuK (DUF458 family)